MKVVQLQNLYLQALSVGRLAWHPPTWCSLFLNLRGFVSIALKTFVQSLILRLVRFHTYYYAAQ